MRLTEVHVEGFKKLRQTRCTIPGKLTAFVGPNEVGKSSLLEALLQFESREPIPYMSRPRGLSCKDDANAISVRFELSAEEASKFSLPAPRQPYVLTFTKRYDGKFTSSLSPRVPTPVPNPGKALSSLEKFASTKAGRSWAPSREEDVDYSSGDLLLLVQKHLRAKTDWDDKTRDLARSLVVALKQDGSLIATRAADALQEVVDTSEQPSPHETARVAISAARPTFELFSEQTRNLASSYNMSTLVSSGTPDALHNLFVVAGLSLPHLNASRENGEIGQVTSLIFAANKRLAELFRTAWNQASITVSLTLSGDELSVLVSNDAGDFSTFAEHSDGLRTYVALLSFLLSKVSSSNVILLIDEAEQHLHYDAQADLVKMLEGQQLASQVVYTTHSPGCLPSDLGTGIRPVIHAESPETGSRLSNSFWTSGRGFTPLLLAIGAGAAAFTPSRYAVLVEGASEMLLLPTLLREANNITSLAYQVVPGISESSLAELSELELTAPRVVYLLDNDAGGDRLRERLLTLGVTESRILSISKSEDVKTLEDLLDSSEYVQAINAILGRHRMTDARIKVEDIDGPRAKALKAWTTRIGCSSLSKTAIATELVNGPHARLLSNMGKRDLRRLHTQVLRNLLIPEPS